MSCKFPNQIPIVIIFFLISANFLSCSETKTKKLNVLFIAVDDLGAKLGCYGNALAKTPNFDRLAHMGVQFNNAYCQLPLCNPTRASVLTGLRPDVTKVYDLDRHFREEVPDVITIIVLWSDHGYHLGEHNGIWQKRTLFEESASAPLIIYDPQAKGNGLKSSQIVEFIDIYPTVAELCDLQVPGRQEGRSLLPLLSKPAQSWKGVAFTQILRPGDDQPFMGRSVRTDQWRYSDWNEGALGEELYDHVNDPNEFTNLASHPEYEEVVRELKGKLEEKIKGQVPQSPFNPARL